MQATLSSKLFLAGSAAVPAQQAGGRRRPAPARPAAQAAEAAAKELLERAAGEPGEGFDGRAFRRSLNQTGRYTRKPSNDPASLDLMEEHGVGYSTTGLVAQMRESGNVWRQGEVAVKLAQAYGFCWGVERAVQMAYEARKAYPTQRLHITNEIIHNPSVNQRLKEMDVNFIDTVEGEKDFSGVREGEVVILPAFGASVQEMHLLNERRVQIVDTTCPWVSKAREPGHGCGQRRGGAREAAAARGAGEARRGARRGRGAGRRGARPARLRVWNAVDNQTRKGHTSIIHGKWAHEETIATASFAGTYLIVKDLGEAQYVCDYVLRGGDRAAFLAKFENATSPGFDPDADLQRIGMANQTTMLKGETEAIGKLLEKTMLQKYGPAELGQRFMERQDAVYDLVGKQGTPEGIDMLLVVGGFNSSNTSHLQEIGEMRGIPSFWVDSATRIDVGANAITHKLAHGELVETKNWLGEGPLVVGVTSGASTPDKAVEDVLDRVFRIKDPSFTGIAPKQTSVGKPVHEEE
eukprot:scaffold15.g4324.t1